MHTEKAPRARASSFRARVLAAVRRIPRGRVATYGDIAALAGHPGAARAVGSVMRTSIDPSVPCHRVIAASGELGGFGSHPQVKRDRLVAEGVVVVGRRIRAFAGVRWTGSVATPPPSRRTARDAVGGRREARRLDRSTVSDP